MLLLPILALYIAIFAGYSLSAPKEASASELAALYGLPTSTSFVFPTTTQAPNDSDEFIVSHWSLGKGRVQDNPLNLAFVTDPFPDQPPLDSLSDTQSPKVVLQVTYPAGSFSHNTGGTQWYNLWNSSGDTHFRTMIAMYEVAFDEGFPWGKGGKLPGLRGGLDSTGCSGGNEADGKSCFSTRLMWRANGAGEVYAYIPPTNNLCKQDQVNCNTDYGISLHRGAFNLASGQWNRIVILVRLNDPPPVANGNVQLFYNDILAIDQVGLQLRSSSNVSINGFYFSTFFGGKFEAKFLSTLINCLFNT